MRAGMHFKYFKPISILHKALYISGNQLLFKEREREREKVGKNIEGV